MHIHVDVSIKESKKKKALYDSRDNHFSGQKKQHSCM